MYLNLWVCSGLYLAVPGVLVLALSLEVTPDGLREPCGMLGIKPSSAACKAKCTLCCTGPKHIFFLSNLTFISQ